MAKDVTYRFIAPIVAPNMMTVSVRPDGSADILFANAVSETEEQISADVIAAVRFGNIEALENLKTNIENTLEEHKKREP